MYRDETGKGGGGGGPPRAKNVLGETLEPCSTSPMTGFLRDGCCNTNAEDRGSHTVCALVTEDFLAFSKARGNDLSTPVPAYGFPGLEPGDRWCLCAPRWREAHDAGKAPHVVLKATHEGDARRRAGALPAGGSEGQGDRSELNGGWGVGQRRSLAWRQPPRAQAGISFNEYDVK